MFFFFRFQLFATDKDLQNNTITYNITSGNDEGIFVIDHETGDIRVNPETINLLDYDRKKQFVMLVQAKDCKHFVLDFLFFT